MSTDSRTELPLGEAAVVMVIVFGWFMLSSVQAMLAGFPTSTMKFTDGSLLGLVVMELTLGTTALVYLQLRGYDLTLLRPRPDLADSARGVALLLAGYAAWAVVAQLFTPSEMADQPIADILHQGRPSLGMALLLSAFNGWYEEAFLLAYLLRGLAARGASFAIGISLLVRLVYHLYQGPLGALSVLVFGLVLSLDYWRTRRLWPAVLAHMLADAVALT